MKLMIRLWLLLMIAFSFADILAKETLSISALPSPQNLDTEVVTNVPFKSWEDGLVKFDYSIAFRITSSNNVELAFGSDVNNDGILTHDEMELTVGWDCGEWFIENVCTGERITSLHIGDYGLHEFSCKMAFSRAGRRIEKIICTDNSAPLFMRLSQEKPLWLFSKSWNLLRIVARGDNVRGDESFSLCKSVTGLRIIFK